MEVPKLKTNLRECITCKQMLSSDKFYILKKEPIKYDIYCKNCRISFQRVKNEQKKNAKVAAIVDYYYKFPQFDYSQPHSMSILALIDVRAWPRAIDYINNKYNVNFNYKDAYLHVNRIKANIYRFFTHKKCKNCDQLKQTYVNSDDVEYVFELLSDTTIPIIPAEFRRSKASKDGWSENCEHCIKAIKMYQRKGRKLMRLPKAD